MTTKLEDDLHALFEAQTRSLGIGEPPPLDDQITIHPADHRDRRRPLAIAAALVLIVGGAALWWATDTRGNTTPADQPGTGLMPTEPPLLRMDAAGWTPDSFTEVDPAPNGDKPDRQEGGFDGPVVALPPTAAGWLLDDPISGDRGVLLIHGRPHPAFQPPPEAR